MSEEELEFIKHCGEHFEVLTGGRGHSKTKQIIEQLQQENQQLKEVIEEVREVINGYIPNEKAMCKVLDEIEFILDKGVKDE